MTYEENLVLCCKQLISKLNEIHDDPKYQAVWQIYAIHGMTYSGPNYEEELRDLVVAVKKHEDQKCT